VGIPYLTLAGLANKKRQAICKALFDAVQNSKNTGNF
jgi:hypothetical protein